MPVGRTQRDDLHAQAREARRPATSAAARNRNTVITPWRAPMAKVKRGAMNRKL